MVDTSELNNYLNDITAKDGDIIEILSEGAFKEMENITTKQKYKALEIPVSNGNRKDLLYQPNRDAIKVFNKNFGTNTTSWIGKKFQVKIYPKTAFGVTKNAILPVIL